MAVAEAALDVVVDAQQVARLEREVVALRKELAQVRRQHQALSIRTFGGTIKEARASGAFRVPPGAPPDGKVAGLHGVQSQIEAIYEILYGEGCGTDATAEEPGGLLKRLDDLEQRAVDGAQVDFQYDGERTLTARCGKATRMWTLPVLLDAGGYKEGQYYSLGDVVSSGGAMFIAKEAGFLRKPSAGTTAWRCCVRAGRDGRDCRCERRDSGKDLTK